MKVTLEAFSERYKYEDPKDLIGKGGFSEVYKAWDKEDEQFVALKIATVITSEKYSLASEVKKIKKLRHPNLIEYYEIYEQLTTLPAIEPNACLPVRASFLSCCCLSMLQCLCALAWSPFLS